MKRMTRRDFIKIGAGGTAAAAMGSGLTTEWWGMDSYQVADPGTDGDRVVPTFCEICFWKCGLLAHVRDGHVTKLEGNPAHPLSRGRLCPRGLGGTGMLYDPDRLRQPLVRTRSRGEDVFEAVSWDEALGLVAEKMTEISDRYGPEAMAIFSHGAGGTWFKHLFKAYGTANIAGPSYAQCRGPREEGYRLTMGRSLGSPEPIDIANARVMTLIGSHLGENMHNTQVQELAEALDRGMEMVVVDPRFSVAASKARYWLPIRPGTDIALLLAWMHVIVTENRYDAAYINRYANGFAQLREHVADKTPEWAYVRTGIEPALIRETGRFIASARPASLIHPGRRAIWYGNDTQRARAMAILAALLGSYGHQGGYLMPDRMSVPDYPTPDYDIEPVAPADHPRGAPYPLSHEALASGLRDASIPGTADYDIKGWMVYGTNLIQSVPEPQKTIEAIQNLDFIVSVDVLPAEICGWSDVVLPEATYLERYDNLWAPSYKEPFVAMRQPVVEPMYDSKPGSWIAKELANRLGLERYFPWRDAAEVVERRAEMAGLDFAKLQEDGVIVGEVYPVSVEEGLEPSFNTPSGKIELYSQDLADMGFDPLPNCTLPEQPPPGYMRLLTGRAPMHSFGRTTNNRFLSETYNENEIWVNTEAAKSLPGFESRPLTTGDYVVLVNQDEVQSEPVKAKVTERIRGDAVYLVHGYGNKSPRQRFAYGRGAADNPLITRVAVDPIMGGPGMNVNFVRVERAARQEV